MDSPITEANIRVYIEEAEALLLEDGEHFDEQSREFICCVESKDVIACPGSGKTTALVAKLYILTKFMPFEDGSGICVLTHTNVAIDLIKEKLGKQGSILFEHPNFCGTIQSFVDAYLAQPSYVSMFGHRISTIDDDFAYSYLVANLKRWKAVNQKPNFLGSIKDLRIDFPTCNLVDKKGYPFSTPFTTEKTKYIRDEIKWRKVNAVIKGILFYDEAYCLGQSYLNENPQLSGAFSKRFKYVFIDEAQDTSSVQYSILNNLFVGSIVQMIGDPNQAIFDSPETGEECCNWAKDVGSKPHIRIHNSKRLSAPIALSIKNIAEFPEESLQGNQNRRIKPVLIFYSHARIRDVIPKFAELISINGLYDVSKYPHKAIGRVVKRESDNNHFRLPSYFPEYYRTSKQKRVFDGLRQYLVKPKNSEDLCHVKQVSDLLIGSLIKMLTLSEIFDKSSKATKPFTKASLLEFLCNRHNDLYYSLLSNLSSWSRRILSHACRPDCQYRDLQYPICVFNEMVNYVKEVFFPIFRANFSKIQSFIEHEVEGIQRGMPLDNEYHASIDGQDIRIEVGSVHSVKGETHTSTLFLDTYYRTYDSRRLVRFFTSGGRDSDRRDESICKALRVAYVAMSRPTHLLCVAFPLPEGQPILDYWQNTPEQDRLWDIELIQ